VRQADLPEAGVPLPGAVMAADPDGGPVASHPLSDHTSGAAVAHDVDRHPIVLAPLRLPSTDAANQRNLGKLRPVPAAARPRLDSTRP
jgi:hypothetical protein